MLVIVSDLHLADNSAGEHNVPAEAFIGWLADVLALADQNDARELVFLYLGDIVDLLRTEYWFYSPDNTKESFALGDRPWGDPDAIDDGAKISPLCRQRSRDIWNRIEETCRDQLALMSGNLDRLSPELRDRHAAAIAKLGEGLQRYDGRVRRYYVPGNHDRLYLVDDDLKRAIDTAMGVAQTNDEADGFFTTYFASQRYRVLARHGHEADVWNFERFENGGDLSALTLDDYTATPIGDPITTEIAARLPYAVKQRLDSEHPVYRHLQNIENVRPLHAGVNWVLGGLDRLPGDAQDIVTECVRAVADDFLGLPFVQRWDDKHDRLGVDETTKLWGAIQGIRTVAPRTVAKAMEVLSELGVFGGGDERHVNAAQRDLQTARGASYCVYGHTHRFDHRPLRLLEDGHEVVYFNSGTWRPRVHQTHEKDGFVEVKEMSWLVFYSEEEDATLRDYPSGTPKGVSYETWTGNMLKRKRSV